MPCRTSMLVSQPRMSTPMVPGVAVTVGVIVGEEVGSPGVSVVVTGIRVSVAVAVDVITAGEGENTKGVTVSIRGVRDGVGTAGLY